MDHVDVIWKLIEALDEVGDELNFVAGEDVLRLVLDVPEEGVDGSVELMASVVVDGCQKPILFICVITLICEYISPCALYQLFKIHVDLEVFERERHI